MVLSQRNRMETFFRTSLFSFLYKQITSTLQDNTIHTQRTQQQQINRQNKQTETYKHKTRTDM